MPKKNDFRVARSGIAKPVWIEVYTKVAFIENYLDFMTMFMTMFMIMMIIMIMIMIMRKLEN